MSINKKLEEIRSEYLKISNELSLKRGIATAKSMYDLAIAIKKARDN